MEDAVEEIGWVLLSVRAQEKAHKTGRTRKGRRVKRWITQSMRVNASTYGCDVCRAVGLCVNASTCVCGMWRTIRTSVVEEEEVW